jgi:DNA-binding PucR family transcriptional regulator
MATKKKSGKTSAKSDKNPQVQRILESAGDTRPNVAAFVQWIVDQGGPEMDVEHTQIVISSYKHFQKSDAALAYRSEVASSREEQQAARDAAREEARAAREAKKAAEAAKKEKAAAKTAKSTKGKSTAAKESVPKAAAKKAPAKKVAAAKSPAKKKAARKAAF